MHGPWLVTFYLMAWTEKTVLMAFNSTALNSQPNKSTERHQILKDLTCASQFWILNKVFKSWEKNKIKSIIVFALWWRTANPGGFSEVYSALEVGGIS